MNLCFFGGTFDPPHNGHLQIAQYCLNTFDHFLFIPAAQSPFKKKSPQASGIQRMQMLKLLIIDLPNTDICDYEIQNEAPSYSWNTIQYLKREFRPDTLTMVIGTDQLSKLHLWKNAVKIKDNVQILCFNRNGLTSSSTLKENSVKFISDFTVPFSSSQIRQKLFESDESLLPDMVPESILEFIKNQNLYH